MSARAPLEQLKYIKTLSARVKKKTILFVPQCDHIIDICIILSVSKLTASKNTKQIQPQLGFYTSP